MNESWHLSICGINSFHLVLVVILLHLSGCIVGPNFEPTTMSLPDHWEYQRETDNSKNHAKAGVVDPKLAIWWETFNDELLVSLIKRAISGSFDVDIIEARLRQARAIVVIAGAPLIPQFGASGNLSRNGRAISSTNITGGNRMSQTLYQVGFDASWELDLFGGVARRKEAAVADLETAQANLNSTIVSISAEIAARYLTLRSLQDRTQVASDNLSSVNKTRDIVKKRFEAGFVSSLDLATIEAEVASVNAQIIYLRGQVREAIHAISVLIGEPPLSLAGELDAIKDLPHSVPIIDLGSPAEVIRRRPDLQSVEAAVHAANARVGAAIADFFPKLSLSAVIGTNAGHLGALDNWSQRIWSLSGSTREELYNGGALEAAVERERGALDEALSQYKKSVLQALKEVEDALLAQQNERLRLESLDTAVAYNMRACELAQKQYSGGLAEFLTVLNAERSLFNAKDERAQSRLSLELSLVSLYKALGGGWEFQS